MGKLLTFVGGSFKARQAEELFAPNNLKCLCIWQPSTLSAVTPDHIKYNYIVLSFNEISCLQQM